MFAVWIGGEPITVGVFTVGVSLSPLIVYE